MVMANIIFVKKKNSEILIFTRIVLEILTSDRSV